MISLQCCLLLSCYWFSFSVAKKSFTNSQDFFGNEVATEIQLIHPENVVHGDSLGLTDHEYSITDIFPLQIHNDEIVTVSFFASYPNDTDWIAAYSPPYKEGDDITAVEPVKYGYCSDSADYLKSGNGSLYFNLTNLRSEVNFVYFLNDTAFPVYMNQTNTTVSFLNPNEPLRPRIVATGDPDKFTLLWSSFTSATPRMKWGTESGVYTTTVDAITSTIDKEDLCGAPATTTGWRDLGLIHHANLTGLTALSNSKVFYTFGDDATAEFSREYVLNVPPLAGEQPPNRGTRVILFDDLGRGSTDDTFTWNEYGRPSIFTTEAVAAEIEAGTVDAIYHGGDISYATGHLSVWDFFMDMIAPMAATVVYLTTVGNHESDWINSATIFNVTDSGGECGVLTTELLPMPAPATTDKPWWSYDVGLIHMVGMSTEHEFDIGTEQYNWLEHDLKTVNRSKTPWIVFGGHRAMYINSNYDEGPTSDIPVMNRLIDSIEPLLWEHRVNIGFYGHNHAVQRHSAVFNRTVVQASVNIPDQNGNEVAWHVNPQATVHMVVGTGGAMFTQNAVTPNPEWCELVFYEYGYARVEAVDSHTLNWEWVNSETGEVRDRMTVTQLNPHIPWVLPVADEDKDDDKKQPFSQTGMIAVIAASAAVFIGLLYLYFKRYAKATNTNDKDSKDLLGGTEGTYHPIDSEDVFAPRMETEGRTHVAFSPATKV